MNRAVMPITDYENTCDKIREKTETTDLIRSGELPDKIDEVYEAGQVTGQKTEYDRFWDNYQRNGTRYGYYYAFAGSGWNDETFKPKYDIVLKGSNIYAFAYCAVIDLVDTLEKLGVFLDTSLSTTNNYMFYSAQTKRLPPINLTGHWTAIGVFNECWNLESIEKIIVIEQNEFSDAFKNCAALKNVIFEGVIGQNGLSFADSPLLTKESLLNIIDCLKDFREITTITTKVTSTKPITITNGTLEEGERYTWSYYDSTHPGWVIDDAASYPTSEEVQITSTAGKVVVNGKEYTGFKASYTNYVNTPHVAGGYKIYVYQDGNEIKTVAHKAMGEDDIIKLNIPTAPTETRSITFGTTNLAKLTDAEKAVATQKGWTLL